MKTCWNCGASVPDSHRYCLTCGMDTTAGPGAKDPMIGKTVVGKYKIESQLGSGAMGTIFKAEQVMLGKTVVIKLLHKHLLSDPELIQRFHREARAASRLNHPNCVQIIDFGTTDDGSLYIAMEYIQGIDLATLLERSHPVDLRRLIHIMKQVCQALDEAHANGVLHRDLKPENIMIENRRTAVDHVKVVDFGIAKLEENNPNSKRSFQTRTGIVCGTPEYMSPEQARGQKLDGRSDMYAIGVMLYHMVTDRLPFEASSPIEVVTKHISEPPVPPGMYRNDLPDAFERLILALLEKDREKRPASAMDVHAELERIDRELAAARREKIDVKEADDATQVDMRPISELVDAIDHAIPAVRAQAAAHPPTPVATPAPLPVTRSTRGQRPVPAAAPAAQEPEGAKPNPHTDTIPENHGRALSEKMSSLMMKDVRRPDRAVAPPREATDRAPTEPAPASSARLVATGGKPRPSVHDSVTVEVASAGPKSAERLAAGAGQKAASAPTPRSNELATAPKVEASGPRKRLKVWLIVGGLAIAAGVGAVLALTLP